jgi:hypothetical protein
LKILFNISLYLFIYLSFFDRNLSIYLDNIKIKEVFRDRKPLNTCTSQSIISKVEITISKDKSEDQSIKFNKIFLDKEIRFLIRLVTKSDFLSLAGIN